MLSLINCDVSDEIVDDIIALRRLKVLIIKNTSISENGIDKLRKEMPFCQINPPQNRFSLPFLLTRFYGDGGLDLCSTRPEFDDDDIKKIVHLPLKELDIRNSKVTRNSIVALENTKTLKSLQANTLKLDDESMTSLSKLPNLEEVVFSYTTFQGKSLALLLGHPKLKKLRLHTCRFDESTFSSLPNNSEITVLSIQGSTVTNKVVDHLSKLQRLESIDIAMTKIDLKGALCLIQNCKTIKNIYVLNQEEFESAIKAIRSDIDVSGF